MKLGPALCFCSALLLQACLATSGPEILHHDLRPALPASAGIQIPLRVRVEPFQVRGGRNRLEFTVRSEAAQQLGWRNYHRYVRRPSDMVDGALLEGLRARQAFLEVQQAGLQLAPDLVLSGELSAFEQIYERAELSGPSQLLIELKAELSSRGSALEPELRRITSQGRVKVGARDVEGDRADVATAAQAALELAVADLSQQVIELAQTFGPKAAEQESSAPALLDLRVEAGVQQALDTQQSLRINRLRVASGLDRHELLSRVARHRLVVKPDMRWQRRPSDVIQDGLVELFRAGGLTVLRSAQQGRADLSLDGYLRRFELDETGAVPEALVELEVSVESAATLASGRSPIGGGSPDDLAAAFEAAVQDALADVWPLVRQALAQAPEQAEPEGRLPEQRFLIVEPEQPLVSEQGLRGSVRVVRLDMRPDLDRMEILLKRDGLVMELLDQFRWQRRPAQRLTDALEKALRSAQGTRGMVGGPLSSGEFDYQLGGRVSAYGLREKGKAYEAEVEVLLELSIVQDGQSENERSASSVGTIPVRARAPVSALEEGAISKGMSQALSTLLQDVSTQVLKEVQAMAAVR